MPKRKAVATLAAPTGSLSQQQTTTPTLAAAYTQLRPPREHSAPTRRSAREAEDEAKPGAGAGDSASGAGPQPQPQPHRRSTARGPQHKEGSWDDDEEEEDGEDGEEGEDGEGEKEEEGADVSVLLKQQLPKHGRHRHHTPPHRTPAPPLPLKTSSPPPASPTAS